MKVTITAILATSDHDGYCSGSECEYKTERMEFIIQVPNEMNDKISEEHYNDWTKYLPTHNLSEGGGSNYCDLSNECVENGLYKHEYKYTIISIEFVDNK